MTKKIFRVVIEEINTYEIEVEAENEQEAEELAYENELYVKGIPTDTDSTCTEVEEVEE